MTNAALEQFIGRIRLATIPQGAWDVMQYPITRVYLTPRDSRSCSRSAFDTLAPLEMSAHRYFQLFRALVLISKQVHSCEQKLNKLLEKDSPDFSKEDAEVLKITEDVEAARHRIPPSTPRTNPV